MVRVGENVYNAISIVESIIMVFESGSYGPVWLSWVKTVELLKEYWIDARFGCRQFWVWISAQTMSIC